MKKDFIVDGKRVRRCDSNVSKMNVFEHIYFNIFHWGCIKELIAYYIFESFKELVKNLWIFVFNLGMLILLPFGLLASAIVQIKEAKKRCERNNRMKANTGGK